MHLTRKGFSTVVLVWLVPIACAATAQAQNVVPFQNAQQVRGWTPGPDAKTFDAVNCSLLKGQPLVCVLNETNIQVTDIECESKGFFGGTKTRTIELPRGGVAAHSVTLVNMKSCYTTLILTMPGGKERRIPNVNTDNMTMIEVPQQ